MEVGGWAPRAVSGAASAGIRGAGAGVPVQGTRWRALQVGGSGTCFEVTPPKAALVSVSGTGLSRWAADGRRRCVGHGVGTAGRWGAGVRGGLAPRLPRPSLGTQGQLWARGGRRDSSALDSVKAGTLRGSPRMWPRSTSGSVTRGGGVQGPRGLLGGGWPGAGECWTSVLKSSRCVCQ